MLETFLTVLSTSSHGLCYLKSFNIALDCTVDGFAPGLTAIVSAIKVLGRWFNSFGEQL